MTRHIPLLATLTGAAWFIGVLLHLGDTQELITRQASRALKAESPLHASFDQVDLTVRGQEVTLSGKVATEALKAAAEDIVRNKVRIQGHRGADANPVTEVHNDLKVDASMVQRAPESPAWWAWGGAGKQAWLFGEVPDEAARQRLGVAFNTAFPLATLTNSLSLVPGRAMPPAETTISFPAGESGKPWAGVAGLNVEAKAYDASVSDAAAAADFAKLKLDAAVLTKGWEAWRNRVANPVVEVPPAPAPAPAPVTPPAPEAAPAPAVEAPPVATPPAAPASADAPAKPAKDPSASPTSEKPAKPAKSTKPAANKTNP